MHWFISSETNTDDYTEDYTETEDPSMLTTATEEDEYSDEYTEEEEDINDLLDEALQSETESELSEVPTPAPRRQKEYATDRKRRVSYYGLKTHTINVRATALG